MTILENGDKLSMESRSWDLSRQFNAFKAARK